MKLNDCIKRIEKYMCSNDNHPRFVNVTNCADMNELCSHFKVGTNIFKSVEDYANSDEAPSESSLLNELRNSEGCIFITGFSTFYKLLGEQKLRDFLKTIISLSVSNLKAIIICYQCEKYLRFSDSRYNNWVYLIDGNNDNTTKLVFSPPDSIISDEDICVNGIHALSGIIEKKAPSILYVVTSKKRATYQFSLLDITEQSSGFDLLCTLDSSTAKLKKEYGTDSQWNYAIHKVKEFSSLYNYTTKNFGSINTLDLSLPKWDSFDDNKKWMYFILLKLYGAPNSFCLNLAVELSDTYSKLIKSIYQGLLKLSHTDANYWECYNERKYLIQLVGNSDVEVSDYCKWVLSKGKDAIYYLTDMTTTEINMIFSLLDDYGKEYSRTELLEILNHIYPDLYQYLLPYDYKNTLLNNYFADYKYQKVINSITPEFLELVEEQAKKREYNLLLPCRSEKIESIDVSNALVYFVDAMGVEYLSYIMAQCQKYNLMAFTTLCHCEIPSITCKNKEFIEVFKSNGAKFAKDENGIKELDELKHHGVEDFDYNNNKLPTYIREELRIISDVIEKAHTKLQNDDFTRIIIISDHGASRLSVISEQENKHQMHTNGIHSGRCCPKSESDVQPDCAIDGDDFWALANYDRFKGGRKANIEVHGGATLEEVVIPIIEITKAASEYEFEIKTPRIKFSKRKKNASIQIFSKEKLDDVTIRISRIDNVCSAVSSDGRNFVVDIPELKSTGDYSVDIYLHNNLVKSGLKFHADNSDFSEKNLL